MSDDSVIAMLSVNSIGKTVLWEVLWFLAFLQILMIYVQLIYFSDKRIIHSIGYDREVLASIFAQADG